MFSFYVYVVCGIEIIHYGPYLTYIAPSLFLAIAVSRGVFLYYTHLSRVFRRSGRLRVSGRKTRELPAWYSAPVVLGDLNFVYLFILKILIILPSDFERSVIARADGGEWVCIWECHLEHYRCILADVYFTKVGYRLYVVRIEEIGASHPLDARASLFPWKGLHAYSN